jgi:(p)ppGpp synthase/HD superfamily hydrolase
LTILSPLLTSRFSDAFAYALDVHGGMVRKGSQIPYIAHLLGVTSLVLQYGGTEDEAIGALLHDAAEDAGGYDQLAKIEARFGPHVAAIVHGCSDSFDTPKKPWLDRKREYINHVASVSASAILVSVSDKIHNVGAIIADYRTHGDALWARFNPDAGKAGTIGYYRGLVTAYRATTASVPHSRAVDDLDRLVTELEALVGMPGAWPPQ